MKTEEQRADKNTDGVETVSCHNCRATMVRGMRFCRSCGYRLGEGMEEYVQTVRFDNSMGIPNFAPGPQNLSTSGAQTTAFAPANAATPARRKNLSCSPSRGNWVMWMVISLAIFVATGGWVFKSLRINGVPITTTVSGPRSFFGTSEFQTVPTDDGVLIESVMPGSPADKAGLVGGDIVTVFDGDSVHGEDDMRKKLRQTPVGKTVEVEYVRDSESKKTLLTTISSESYDSDDFFGPQGKGFLGISGLDRVEIPQLKIYGVEVGNVSSNRPADIAGWRENDIVIGFNGTPIRTPKELSHRIDRATPGSTVNTVIIRNGERLEIPVKVGRE